MLVVICDHARRNVVYTSWQKFFQDFTGFSFTYAFPVLVQNLVRIARLIPEV